MYLRGGNELPPQADSIIRTWSAKLSTFRTQKYTETQLEQAFNDAIFTQILGYRSIGSGAPHNIVPKRTGEKGRDVPDFVLGTFDPALQIERWRAVGEIKGVGTDLDAPQTSRFQKESPVEQGFRYALHGRPGVEWIIVTNYTEIRLYRNGYLGAYEAWTLKELSENREKLVEFFILLCQKNLAPDSGSSETIKILEKSLTAGIKVTEGFYGLYGLARQSLIDALSSQIDSNDAALLYGKAHKLLNRALFCAFCEDHPSQLLPPKTLQQVHIRAGREKGGLKYWREFLKLFTELDKGSPPGSPNAFHAFNGGLFAPDPLLDGIKLPDSLFTDRLRFNERGKQSREIEGIFGFHVYDFAGELDVDALGAIFEQSLKDIPVGKKLIRGHGSLDSNERASKGVFYTPREITHFLISRALRHRLEPLRKNLLSEVKNAAVKKRLKVGNQTRSLEETRDAIFHHKMMEHLKRLNILDPACGSGAFLVEAFRILHDEYEAINNALGELEGARPLFGLDRLILRNNLYGIDILGESVELTKLSIWLRTASKSEPLEALNNTIVCGDGLRNSVVGASDIVVSNPPWGAELDGWDIDALKGQFPQCGEEVDSFAIFIIRAHSLLKPGGVLAFITPNSWLTVRGYEKFRRWILEAFEVLEIVNLWKVFKDVNHDACLLVARRRDEKETPEKIPMANVRAIRRGGSETEKWGLLAKEEWSLNFQADPQKWKSEPFARFETMYPPKLAASLDRVAKKALPLGDCCDITVGIQVYHHRKVSRDIIENRAFHAPYRKGPDYYPFATGNEVQRYFQVEAHNSFLLYSDDLCDKRSLEHYSTPRILIQQIFWGRLSATLSSPDEPSLYLNTLFSLSSPAKGFTLEYLLAVINSRFVSACYERWANRLFGDKFPKVSKIDLQRLPIPRPSKIVRAKLEALAKRLSTNWNTLKKTAQRYADAMEVLDPSTQLAGAVREYWTLGTRDFVAELQRASVPLTPTQISGAVELWKETKNKTDKIWAQISTDEMESEELIRIAYGVEEEIYEELISRAPAIAINDILLPKT